MIEGHDFLKWGSSEIITLIQGGFFFILRYGNISKNTHCTKAMSAMRTFHF